MSKANPMSDRTLMKLFFVILFAFNVSMLTLIFSNSANITTFVERGGRFTYCDGIALYNLTEEGKRNPAPPCEESPFNAFSEGSE